MWPAQQNKIRNVYLGTMYTAANKPITSTHFKISEIKIGFVTYIFVSLVKWSKRPDCCRKKVPVIFSFDNKSKIFVSRIKIEKIEKKHV